MGAAWERSDSYDTGTAPYGRRGTVSGCTERQRGAGLRTKADAGAGAAVGRTERARLSTKALSLCVFLRAGQGATAHQRQRSRRGAGSRALAGGGNRRAAVAADRVVLLQLLLARLLPPPADARDPAPLLLPNPARHSCSHRRPSVCQTGVLLGPWRAGLAQQGPTAARARL